MSPHFSLFNLPTQRLELSFNELLASTIDRMSKERPEAIQLLRAPSEDEPLLQNESKTFGPYVCLPLLTARRT